MPDTNETLRESITELESAVFQLQNNPPVGYHTHNSFDSTQVYWSDLALRKFFVHHTIVGTGAATAANYGVFFIAPAPVVVSGAKEVHQTKGTDAGTVTLAIEKLTGTQALDAGSSIMSDTFNLKGTINTVLTGTITTTSTIRTLATGDRLAMKDTGTLTAVANVTVLIELTLL